MDSKKVFISSLSDAQLGFFYAHEYDSNQEELLTEELNVRQFSLYKTWKTEEALLTSGQDVLTKKLDRMELMLEKITTRLETLEDRAYLNIQTTNDMGPVMEKMAGFEHVLETIMTKVEMTEDRTKMANELKDDNDRLQLEQTDRTEKSQIKFISRLEEMENRLKMSNSELSRTVKSSLKKIESFQENLAIKQEAMEETLKQTKQKPEQQNLRFNRPQTSGKNLKSPLMAPTLKTCFRILTVPRVEILKDYTVPGISVKKGEILGLLDNSHEYHIRCGDDIKDGWIPRNFCKEIGGEMEVQVAVS